jgi:hypothetical protein
LSAEVPLRPRTLRSTDVGAFESDLRVVIAGLARNDSLTATTPLPALLTEATHTESVMATVVEAVVLQLVLLTLIVLYSLVALSGRDRQPEIDIARRRGFPRRSLLVVAIGEPVILLAAALPLGILIAWGATVAAGPALFGAGTPVDVPSTSVVTAVAGFLGGVVAAIVATWDLWHGATRASERQSRRRSGAAAADACAVALAAAGLIALAARGSLDGTQADPVALLAPGLLAVGAGVIGLRLAELAVRAALRPSEGSPRVASFLAVREVSRRRPSVLRQLLPVTVAIVLVVFAVCSWALASTNRSNVAAFEVGAARVVDVDVRAGVNLVTAVRRADPSGRWAMAAAVYRSPQGDLLAVDASRLAAVATWPAGLTARSVRDVARYLSPPTRPPVTFRGDSLSARIALSAGAPPIDLSVTVFNEESQDQDTIVMGPLGAGTRTYVGSLEGFCLSVCRLVNLSPSAPDTGPHAPAEVHMTVDSLAAGAAGTVEHPVAFGAGVPRSWTATPSQVETVSGRSAPGVSFSLPVPFLVTQGIVLAPADVPRPVPIVVTDTLDSVDAPAPPDDAQTVVGLDGGSLAASGEILAPTLPEIGSEAALVDLPFAQLAQTAPSQAVSQVWLSATAPPSILRRLRTLGVTVSTTASASARAAVLDKGPLAVVYVFVLYSAPVAALMAIGACAFALLATGRRRRRDLRALTVVGVTRATVVRAILLETALVLGVALVVGCVVGIAASRLALSSLPQFPDGTGGVPISSGLPLLPLVAVVAALVVVLALTAVLTTYVTLRGTAVWRPVGGEP